MGLQKHCRALLHLKWGLVPAHVPEWQVPGPFWLEAPHPWHLKNLLTVFALPLLPQRSLRRPPPNPYTLQRRRGPPPTCFHVAMHERLVRPRGPLPAALGCQAREALQVGLARTVFLAE